MSERIVARPDTQLAEGTDDPAAPPATPPAPHRRARFASLTRRLVNPPKDGPDAPDAREFEAIYAQHFAFVWRCLRGLGVPVDALDDAAQDVFVVVHRRLRDFRGESSLKTWLYGILRHVAANLRRSERRRGELVQRAPEPPLAVARPDERAQEREAALFVQDFLHGVDDKKRDVFVLALLEQMSMPEVAATLEIPLNTAYTRLRSVRQEFKRALTRRRPS